MTQQLSTAPQQPEGATMKTKKAEIKLKPAMPVKEPPTTGDDELDELLQILSYVRPHGGPGENLFITRFIKSIPGVRDIDDWAYAVEVPLPDGSPSRTLFSSHVDTVHPLSSMQVRQSVDYDANLYLALPGGDHILGADDGAGVWLMRRMIDARVPGTYVFHRGEERGGLGSDYLAKHHAKWLEGFDRAVAFDRKGTDSVITHQGFGRCCSDTFAWALGGALNRLGEFLEYHLDDGGVFTDTANYTGLIPECTNLSCGYEYEHTANEMLDVDHLVRMKDALIKVEWETLPIEREPVDEEAEYMRSWVGFNYTGGAKAKDVPPWDPDVTIGDLYDMDWRELSQFVYEEPEQAADLMWRLLWGERPDTREET